MLHISAEPIVYDLLDQQAAQQETLSKKQPSAVCTVSKQQQIDLEPIAELTPKRCSQLFENIEESFVQLTQKSEPLSWKFLEQVSSLDSQLRSVVEINDLQLSRSDKKLAAETATDACLSASECHLMSSNNQTAADTKISEAAVSSKSILDIDRQQSYRNHKQEQLEEQSAQNLSNGFALTGLLNVEILSQQIAAAAAGAATTTASATEEQQFQFTTPTSTFRRKKQQQQQQLEKSLDSYGTTIQRTLCKRPDAAALEAAAAAASAAAAAAATNNAEQQEQRQATMLAPGGHTDSANFGSTVRTLPAISRQQQQQSTHPSKHQTHQRNLSLRKSNNKMGLITASNNNGDGGSSGSANEPTITATTGATTTTAMTSLGATAAKSTAGGATTMTDKRNRSGMTIGPAAGMGGFVDGIETYLGLIGWRKKCLYTLLLLLMLLIITNLVLTLWILKVMEFSTDGMGQLKIVPGGIQLSGQAIIMDMLRASTIRSRNGQPISIESSRNFSINTRDPNGMLENHLFLGHDKLECLSAGFRINDTNGRNLFSVNRNEVTIGAHALRIEGEGGAIFRESIQTPHVRAEPGRELRLESPTRQLEMTAAKDITLQSRAGGIELLALEDVRLRALDGSLRLESSKILMPNLRTAQPPIMGSAQSRDHLHRVFQLCACSNGKLFLAAPHSICAGDDSTVCR